MSGVSVLIIIVKDVNGEEHGEVLRQQRCKAEEAMNSFHTMYEMPVVGEEINIYEDWYTPGRRCTESYEVVHVENPLRYLGRDNHDGLATMPSIVYVKRKEGRRYERLRM